MDVVPPGDHESSGLAGRSGNSLQMLATQVKERGLEVREHWRDGVLTEIAVTSPEHPELGRAVMGCDGFFTWERSCKFSSADDVRAVAQTIFVMLDENMRTDQIKTERKSNAQCARRHRDGRQRCRVGGGYARND